MLMKCNECKNEVSSDARICPHCGFELYKTPQFVKNEENKILILKRNRLKSPIEAEIYEDIGLLLGGFGFLIFPFLIEIIVMINGKKIRKSIDKNNLQEKDLLFYDESLKSFIAYGIDGEEHIIKKAKALDSISFAKWLDNSSKVTLKIGKSSILLGFIDSRDCLRLRRFLEEFK